MQSPSSLFESLFKKNIADAGNAEYLQQLADEHPYFSPAQFYLLQQKDQGTEAYNNQAVKTSVLFNNNYWLNFQLLKAAQPAGNNSSEIIVPNEEIKSVEDIPADKIIPQQDTQPTQSFQQPVEAKEEAVIQNEKQQETTSIITGDENKLQNELPLEKDIEPTEINIPALKQEPITEETLLFQPLHSTDYFASQGIKLSEEIQPTDKLGKQLKSFTDWLKTMKKITPEKIQVDPAHTAQTDTAIQTLAEKSNTEGEVLTETMAEILAQQGKAEKAIEVYQKLSLLNPSKNIYFAAKIDQLKEH
jgi:hypothetical protein